LFYVEGGDPSKGKNGSYLPKPGTRKTLTCLKKKGPPTKEGNPGGKNQKKNLIRKKQG